MMLPMIIMVYAAGPFALASMAEPGVKVIDRGDEVDVRGTWMMERRNRAQMD